MKLFYKRQLQTEDWVEGVAFDTKDCLLRGQTLSKHFSSFCDLEGFAECCNRLNGSWRAVLNRPCGVYLAVDHRTTYSLYYRLVGGELFVSDNGFDLLLPQETTVCPDWEEEVFFSRWGFTSFSNTLHPHIKRVEAGCAVCISSSGEEFVSRYDTGFCLLPEKKLLDYNSAKREVAQAIDKAMERMCRVVEGEHLLLPLTGGRDSRMIAVALKLNGIQEVECFSYGRDCSIPDAVKAGVVARRLGFPHRFLSSLPPEYGESSYTEDPEAMRFLRYVSGLGSGYFFAEYYPALLLSQENEGRLPTVLPGHNGDILGGDNLFYSIFLRAANKAEFIRFLSRHESGNRLLSRQENRLLLSRLESIIATYPEGLETVEYFEMFRNREIAAKYYINSSRSWQYFGFPVWMPFLDRNLINLMHSLPLEYRWCKRLYEEVTDEYFRRCDVSLPSDTRSLELFNRFEARLKRRIRPFLSSWLLRRNRLWKGDCIGFDLLMKGRILEQVKAETHYRPTTANGLSFAWWLLSLQNGRALL